MSCVVRGLCDELITRPEESYRLYCVVVCDLETSRMGAPYIYDISRLRVKGTKFLSLCRAVEQAEDAYLASSIVRRVYILLCPEFVDFLKH